MDVQVPKGPIHHKKAADLLGANHRRRVVDLAGVVELIEGRSVEDRVEEPYIGLDHVAWNWWSKIGFE